MYFYRIDVEFTEACTEKLTAEIAEGDGRVDFHSENPFGREFSLRLWKETAKFNDGLKDRVYFTADINVDSGVFGIVSESEPYDAKELEAYLKKIMIEASDTKARESALSDIVHMFQNSGARGMVNDQFYELIPIDNRYEYHEIMMQIEEDTVFSADDEEGEADESDNERFDSRQLQEELDRIRSMDVREDWIGHPVHYLIEADDEDFQKYAARSIMCALYRQGRIMSRKYMGLSVGGCADFVLDFVYNCCEKGCLFLGIGTEDELSGDQAKDYLRLRAESRRLEADEAKRVIDEVLNYYKVQKLFKERGFIESHPVMHMVFAGNPGTAKTTVATLRAEDFAPVRLGRREEKRAIGF